MAEPEFAIGYTETRCRATGAEISVDRVDALAVASARSSSDSPESDELASLSPSPPSLLPSPAFPPVSSFVISSFTVAADESSFFAIAPSVERMDVTFVPTSPVTSSRSSAVPRRFSA